MEKFNLPSDQAHTYVLTRRHCISINEGFRNQIRRLGWQAGCPEQPPSWRHVEPMVAVVKPEQHDLDGPFARCCNSSGSTRCCTEWRP